MKRTNLVLNEELLNDAVRVLGAKTYSDAVNQALKEVIRTAHIRGLSKWVGAGLWEGDLSAMREDSGKKSKRR